LFVKQGYVASSLINTYIIQNAAHINVYHQLGFRVHVVMLLTSQQQNIMLFPY